LHAYFNIQTKIKDNQLTIITFDNFLLNVIPPFKTIDLNPKLEINKKGVQQDSTSNDVITSEDEND